ncbi:hypothetical protein [Pontibacter sp. H249]|uniref:hypothetical protein n=1 Tax=Pontibacter sp. H249 TaxID=3133420 RepID=UPI0030BFB6A6
MPLQATAAPREERSLKKGRKLNQSNSYYPPLTTQDASPHGVRAPYRDVPKRFHVYGYAHHALRCGVVLEWKLQVGAAQPGAAGCKPAEQGTGSRRLPIEAAP